MANKQTERALTTRVMIPRKEEEKERKRSKKKTFRQIAGELDKISVQKDDWNNTLSKADRMRRAVG